MGCSSQGSYTLSKSTDTNSYDGTLTAQNNLDLANSVGASDFDVRHRVSVNATWELPFHGNRLKDGWQLVVVEQAQTGNPFNIVTNITTITGTATVRPDLIGALPAINPHPNNDTNGFPVSYQWFDGQTTRLRSADRGAGAPARATSRSVFALPYNAAGVAHFGNLGRNVMYGPGFGNTDFSIIKNLKLQGSARAQFRVEIFNLFNQANLGQPGRTATVGSTSFGVISNTRFPTGDSGLVAADSVRGEIPVLGREGRRGGTGRMSRTRILPIQPVLPIPPIRFAPFPPILPSRLRVDYAHAYRCRRRGVSRGNSARRHSPHPSAIEETTIAQIQTAFRDGSLTCRALVEQYLARIDAHDKKGAALNAIVMTNPDALKTADDLDRRFRQSGPVGPMHCVPVLVKDNYETIDMPTTAGSLSLKGMMTGADAFVVKRLRDAGAVMIAKSNMAEFAFSPIETVNSILPGYTRNPYDTSRVTAGSSGGSAAGVAANFAAIGLASDTGDSIRGPAAHQALVGLRSTMGLVSRSGVVPLNLGADIAGAVTRTVADTAAVLQVIAGPDPSDPVTAAAREHIPASYAASLRADGLKGARIGVLHQAYDTPTLGSRRRRSLQGCHRRAAESGRRGHRSRGGRGPRRSGRAVAAAISSSTT